MAIKYSISVVKRDPLVKIKVTGVYNEKDQYYYRNPVTGCWQKILEEWNREGVTGNGRSLMELFMMLTCRLKNLADNYYEDSKELFGRSVLPR